jgi:hypothetical protein
LTFLVRVWEEEGFFKKLSKRWLGKRKLPP